MRGSIRDKQGYHLLTAARDGKFKKVRKMLRSGVSANYQDLSFGFSGLICACVGGHLEIVQYLLKAGAELELMDKNGDTALMYASEAGHTHIVRHLLTANAKVDHQSKKKEFSRETLLRSIMMGYRFILTDVIFGHETALMRASQQGHYDTVVCLLEAGADVDKLDQNLRTALDKAEAKKHHSIVTLLKTRSKLAGIKKVVALQDCEVSEWSALKFNKGDILNIIAKAGNMHNVSDRPVPPPRGHRYDMWKLELNGKKGDVHVNYFEYYTQTLSKGKTVDNTLTTSATTTTTSTTIRPFTEVLINPAEIQPETTSSLTTSSSTTSNSSTTPAIQTVLAAQSFKGTEENTLSFNKGDVLMFLGDKSEGWLYCQLGEDKGWAPTSHIKADLLTILSAPAKKETNTSSSTDSTNNENDFTEQIRQIVTTTLRQQQQSLQKLTTVNTAEQVNQLVSEEAKTLQRDIVGLGTQLALLQGKQGNTESRVDTLTIQMNILMTEREVKQAKQKAIQRFKTHPNLILFYKLIVTRTEAFFIGSSAVASSLVDPSQSLGASMTILALDAVTDILSSLPFVSEFGGSIVGLFTSWASKGVEAFDSKRQSNVAMNISDLLTLSELKQTAHEVALRLTERYEEQLRQLILPEQEAEIEIRQTVKRRLRKAKQLMFKAKPSPSAKRLAVFGVMWLFDALKACAQETIQPTSQRSTHPATPTLSIADKLLKAVTEQAPSSGLSRLWNTAMKQLHMERVATSDGRFYHPQDVFTLPGVKVWSSTQRVYEYYTKQGRQPQTYGWMIGLSTEVQHHQLQQTAAPQISGTTPPATPPHSPQVSRELDRFGQQLQQFQQGSQLTQHIVQQHLGNRDAKSRLQQLVRKFHDSNKTISFSFTQQTIFIQLKGNYLFARLLERDIEKLARRIQATVQENGIECSEGDMNNQLIKLKVNQAANVQRMSQLLQSTGIKKQVGQGTHSNQFFQRSSRGRGRARTGRSPRSRGAIARGAQQQRYSRG